MPSGIDFLFLTCKPAFGCSVKASQIIAEQTQLFKITVSFGSVSSSISLPCYMSHASIPAEVRAARGLPDHLVRISVGVEHPQDLLAGKQRSNANIHLLGSI